MDYMITTPQEADAHMIQSSGGRNEVQIFTANEDALNTLIEMGYERNDALYALRITSNNVEHACSYLMSNPNPSRGMAIRDSAGLNGANERIAALEE